MIPREVSDEQQPIEGAFLACSLWLADAYVLAGEIDKAQALFDRVVAVANDLGLLAEEFDSGEGRQTGNFPQALTHIALINTAHNLSAAKKPSRSRCCSARSRAGFGCSRPRLRRAFARRVRREALAPELACEPIGHENVTGGYPQWEVTMSRGMPSMTALLGLLAIAGYQNRDKMAEMLGGAGAKTGPGGSTEPGLGGLLGNLGGCWAAPVPAAC